MREIFKAILIIFLYIKTVIRILCIRIVKKNKKCIFFIATPIHGNLGDHAIVYAQYKIIEEICGKGNIVEISKNLYEAAKGKLERYIRNTDLIIIDGGGNIGTLWILEEYKMRDIIIRFKENPIFIFPQTAYFEQSNVGKIELEKSKKIYNSHPNLTIFCRDTQTYRLISSEFSCVKGIFTPDAVLFINDVNFQFKRSGILLTIRADKERQKENAEKLEKIIDEKRYDIKNTSTIVNKRIFKFNRKKYLYSKWKEFSKAKLVITDRLHGMIFAAITATPCIALDNISHKVNQGYEWIKYLPYVKFIDVMDENLEAEILNFMNNRVYSYDRKPLEKYYSRIKEEVSNAFN